MARIGLLALFLNALEHGVEIAEKGLVIVWNSILLLLVTVLQFGEFRY